MNRLKLITLILLTFTLNVCAQNYIIRQDSLRASEAATKLHLKNAIKDSLDANARGWQTEAQVRQIAGDSSQVAETRAKNYTDTQFNNNPKGWQTASQVRNIVGDSTAYNGLNPNGAIADSGDGEVFAIHNTLIGKRYPFFYTSNLERGNTGYRIDSLYMANNLIYMIQSDGTQHISIPRTATDPINALYVDNNIYAINGGTSTKHISSWYGNIPEGSWTLSQWNSISTLKMLQSTTSLPTFNNFQYNSALYYNEDLRLTQNSVGVNAGRSDIKIKGNQWVNLKTLIESFGLEWTEFKNPYVSWATGSARSELSPNIGACSVVP